MSVAGLYLFFQPSIEFPHGQLNPDSYRNIGIISAVLVLFSAQVCYRSTKKYIEVLNRKQIKDKQEGNFNRFMDSLKSTVQNKAFRAVALCYMFTNLASAFLSNMGLHVFTYTFVLSSQQIAIILAVQFGMSILSQPIWMFITRKIDKKPAMFIGLLISILAGLIFVFLVLLKAQVSSQILYFMPYAIFAGFGTGALFTIPLSMVADTIDLDELERGQRFEGFYFGSLTLYYKLSQAIAIFMIGVLLDLIRFNSALAQQSEFTLLSLGLILAFGSILSFGFAYLSIRIYPLHKDRVHQIQAEIAKIHLNS